MNHLHNQQHSACDKMLRLDSPSLRNENMILSVSSWHTKTLELLRGCLKNDCFSNSILISVFAGGQRKGGSFFYEVTNKFKHFLFF